VKAVVLVGGFGTRMRPLTQTIPKQLLPLVDRPVLDHVLAHLARHGVAEVVLSSPYLGAAFASYLAARREDPVVTWVTEETPLDTGGAILNALDRVGGTFLVLNGDIITGLDVSALVAAHREREAAVTISLSEVADARAFGLVSMRRDGRLLAFKEKPTEPVAGLVNAGVYVIEPPALEAWKPGSAVNVEREIFPSLIEAGAPVFGFVSSDYWIDLGTPEKYLQATFDALEGEIPGLAYVAPHVDVSADVSMRSQLGRWVVVGPHARVGDGAEVEDSVLLAGSIVEPGAKVRDSVLGPAARIGEGALVHGGVLAEGATIAPGATADRVRLGPGETFGE
jgi:mannose-1-phosphate guanylyltransferase